MADVLNILGFLGQGPGIDAEAPRVLGTEEIQESFRNTPTGTRGALRSNAVLKSVRKMHGSPACTGSPLLQASFAAASEKLNRLVNSNQACGSAH